MTDNEVTIPIQDTGAGENTATIRVMGDTLDRDEVREVFGALSYSRAPMTFRFEAQAPPLLVPLKRAADDLGCSEGYVRMLCRAGWLTAVRHLPGEVEATPELLESAERNHAFKGWEVTIPYDQVVEVMAYAREHRRLPSGFELGPHADEHSIRRTIGARVETKPPKVWKLTRQVLEDARNETNEDGGRLYLTAEEVHERVQARMDTTHPGVVVHPITVRSALHTLVNRQGAVDYEPRPREGQKLGHPRRAYAWRWTSSPDHKLRISHKPRNQATGFEGSTSGRCTCGQWKVKLDQPRYRRGGGPETGEVAVRRLHREHREEVLAQ